MTLSLVSACAALWIVAARYVQHLGLPTITDRLIVVFCVIPFVAVMLGKPQRQRRRS
jgi:hypothetical protein